MITAVPAASLRKVTLHAARSKAFPEGSIRHGYDFVAPLTEDGRIDSSLESAPGRMLRPSLLGRRTGHAGLLIHRAGGRGGSTWAFEWKSPHAASDDEDEGFRFGDHVFKVGEYVSIREAEGELVTFRVESVGKP